MPQLKLNLCLHSICWQTEGRQEPVVLTGMKLGECKDVEQQEKRTLVSPSPGISAGASQQEGLQACSAKELLAWAPASSQF